jgi:predicted PurR-regulated permease PerM
MENNPWLRILIVLGVIFVGVQLFGIAWDLIRELSDIILIFVLAWLLAFLLNPAVQFLTDRRDTPRVVAVSTVYLSVLTALVAVAFLIIPPTVSQLSSFGDRVPTYALNASHFFRNLQPWLDDHHIPVDTRQVAISNDLVAGARTFGTQLASNALGFGASLLTAVFDTFVVLIISFYMALDGPRITRAMLQVTPRRFRDDVVLLVASIDRSFGGYVRSSLVLALVYGAGTAAAMFALGLPFALPVSVFSGAMLIVPFVGDFVAILPPVLVGLVSVSPAQVGILLLLLVALQQLVLQILRPRIMGKSVGLHPLWVLAAILAGARIAGVWGAIFAVPVAAIIQTIVQLYYFRAAGNADREDALARTLLRANEPLQSTASAATDAEAARTARAADPTQTAESPKARASR